MRRIYLDNAATTQTDRRVLNAMLLAYRCYGNPSSIHKLGEEARELLEKSRESIASRMSAGLDEIIFTSGGTESNNIAITGIANSLRKKGNHLITTAIEHPSVLNVCRKLEKQGFRVTYLKVDRHGLVSVQELESSITDKTTLVSVMHANNEIGTIEPIEKIGRICREKGVIFHTDACQSFTKKGINVRRMNLDMVSINAHKFHGPKGIGALYVKKELMKKIGDYSVISGGEQESGIRPGTQNLPGIVGMAEAARLVDDSETERMKRMRDYLISKLKETEESRLNGHPAERLCNNVNFAFRDVSGEEIVRHLDAVGIAASTGSACSSLSQKRSHVLRAIKLPESYGSVRLTLGRFNRMPEMRYTADCLREIILNLRKLENR